MSPLAPGRTMAASLSRARGELEQRQRPPIMPRAMSTPNARPQAAVSGGPESVEAVREGLRGVGYLPGESTALVSYLSTRLGKPVLVEGPAGGGKTERPEALARELGRGLRRPQCDQGLGEAKAPSARNDRE